MKITEVRVLVVSAPGDWTFVEIETDEGITGVGEGSNVAGSGSLVVAEAIKRAAHLLIGEDPTHLDALWHKVYRYYTYLGSRGAPSAAVSAVDVALWDIIGKVRRPAALGPARGASTALPSACTPGSGWPGRPRS